ncbi:hypothetical protein BDZ91DRAFT_724004 [Kalaharituber pfeilii]|nr:hypothetical protein BDZ91DRAFT_724004 [Kalaharituber pfeilii]
MLAYFFLCLLALQALVRAQGNQNLTITAAESDTLTVPSLVTRTDSVTLIHNDTTSTFTTVQTTITNVTITTSGNITITTIIGGGNTTIVTEIPTTTEYTTITTSGSTITSPITTRVKTTTIPLTTTTTTSDGAGAQLNVDGQQGWFLALVIGLAGVVAL